MKSAQHRMAQHPMAQKRIGHKRIGQQLAARPWPRGLPIFLLLLLTVFGLGTATVSLGQTGGIEEEELLDRELEPAPVTPENLEGTDLQALYERATTLYPESAMPLFDQVIALARERLALDANDEAMRRILARSLLRQAELHLLFGDLEAATAAVDQALAARLDIEIDSPNAPDALRQLLDRQRRDSTGTLTVSLDPPDTRVAIDGQFIQLSAEGSTPVLAGSHRVSFTRPGYAPYEEVLDIRAGRTQKIEAVLERQSAVIALRTRPAGAEIWIDGELRGTTGETNVPPPALPAAEDPAAGPPGWSVPRQEAGFSEDLVIESVELGLRRLEVRLEGHRPYRAELQIDDLLDYDMPPVVLEPESGMLVFKGMPKNATLEINGRQHAADDPAAPTPRVTLPPGEYSIRIAESSSRIFTRDLRLADRQTIEVNVQLRPGLILLGVLGHDAERANGLRTGLRAALAKGDRWAVIDRSQEARPILETLGLTRDALRGSPDEAVASGPAEDLDWKQAQATLSQRIPGLLYALAVLEEDLLTSRARIWIWAAPPAPSQPDQVVLNLGEIQELERLTARFQERLYLRRPWVGALVVDTAVTPHPVIAQVTPDSPAAQAGLQPGDQLVAIAQVPIFSRSDYEARIAVAEPGEPLEFAVQAPSGPRTVRLRLGSSPRVFEDLGDVPRSIAFTDLRLQIEDAKDADRWILQLNQALIALRAGDRETAVRLLGATEAPNAEQGLGKAAVDYWLGVALLGLGPSYEEQAAAAFQRASRQVSARLYHHDGPWVAPRARARMAGSKSQP